MAKTLTNLQTGVRVYLDESAQADFLDSEVTRSINYAYHNVVSEVINVYEKFYETVTPFAYSQIANQQEYAIDPTLIKVTRVEINYTPQIANSVPLRAVSINSDEAITQLGSLSTIGTFFSAGYYLHGRLDNQTIGFIPIPSNTDPMGTQSIKVWGIAVPSDLVAGTDSVLIPYVDRFGSIIEKLAASTLLRKGQQAEAEASRYMAEAEAEMVAMRTFLKDRQADGAQMIEDYELENIDFEAVAPF